MRGTARRSSTTSPEKIPIPGEIKVLIGSAFAAAVAIRVAGSGPLALVLALAAAFLTGGLWAAIAAWLRYKRNVPEVITTLEELIARQRFNLNRTNRLAKHRTGDKAGAEDPLKITGFEETLVGLTREFTEGVEGLAGEPVEALHRAQEAMTASVEALDQLLAMGMEEGMKAAMGQIDAVLAA